jgi:hypothetical protein
MYQRSSPATHVTDAARTLINAHTQSGSPARQEAR